MTTMSSDAPQKAPRRASLLFRLRRSVSTPLLERILEPVPMRQTGYAAEDSLWEREIPLPSLLPEVVEPYGTMAGVVIAIPKVCLFPPDHQGQPFILFVPRSAPLLQVAPPRPRPVSRQGPFELPTPVFVRSRGILMPTRKDAYGPDVGMGRIPERVVARRVCTDPLPRPVSIVAVVEVEPEMVKSVSQVILIGSPPVQTSTGEREQVRKSVRKKMSLKRFFFADSVSRSASTPSSEVMRPAGLTKRTSRLSLRIHINSSASSLPPSASTSSNQAGNPAESEHPPPRSISKRLSLSSLGGAFKRKGSKEKQFVSDEPVPSIPTTYQPSKYLSLEQLPPAPALELIESPVSNSIDDEVEDDESDCSSILSTDEVTAPRIRHVKVLAQRAVFHMRPSPTLDSISSSSDTDESDVILASPALDAIEWPEVPRITKVEYEETWEEALGLPIS